MEMAIPRLFLFLVLCLYIGETAVIPHIPCGYQRCDSSYQTCRGKHDDNNSLRCYDCSDFIRDVQTDCVGSLGKECSVYCIETLQRILTDERLAFKEKEDSLQLCNRNFSSLIEKLQKTENYIVTDKTNNILFFQIGTGLAGLFFVILVVMFVLYSCVCKKSRKRRYRQSNLSIQMKSSSRTSSLDSGNESEAPPAAEQDRLRQVVPDQTDGTKKFLPTGGKSVENLHHDADEHQSFLKTT